MRSNSTTPTKDNAKKEKDRWSLPPRVRGKKISRMKVGIPPN